MVGRPAEDTSTAGARAASDAAAIGAAMAANVMRVPMRPDLRDLSSQAQRSKQDGGQEDDDGEQRS
jgi:hypothetical protein